MQFALSELTRTLAILSVGNAIRLNRQVTDVAIKNIILLVIFLFPYASRFVVMYINLYSITGKV